MRHHGIVSQELFDSWHTFSVSGEFYYLILEKISLNFNHEQVVVFWVINLKLCELCVSQNQHQNLSSLFQYSGHVQLEKMNFL